MTKLKVTPLTGSIGASVEGIDLNSRIDDETFAELHKAFLKHCVLIYRGQHLKPSAQVEFGRRWGKPLNTNPLLKHLEGHPEIVQVTKIPKATASTEAWHYDSCYTPVPPKISILSAVTVPHGGDTMGDRTRCSRRAGCGRTISF